MGAISEYWDGERARSAQWLAVHGISPYCNYYPSDPGLPAYPWLPDGTPVRIDQGALPVSFVDAARNKCRPLFNLDQLHRGVLAALAGTPDTRTPAQRRHDDWVAYQAAKEKWS
jgi:hypothetical protein